MILSRRSFLKVAGLTVVAAASASMFTGCGSLKPVTIVYTCDTTASKDVQDAVAKLNADKTKTKYIPLMSSTDYAKGYVSSYLKGTGVVVDPDKTTYKVATEGENKGKLVVYVKAAS